METAVGVSGDRPVVESKHSTSKGGSGNRTEVLSKKKKIPESSPTLLNAAKKKKKAKTVARASRNAGQSAHTTKGSQALGAPSEENTTGGVSVGVGSIRRVTQSFHESVNEFIKQNPAGSLNSPKPNMDEHWENFRELQKINDKLSKFLLSHYFEIVQGEHFLPQTERTVWRGKKTLFKHLTKHATS